MAMKVMKWLGIIALILLVIWMGWGIISKYVWEKPVYKVIRKLENVEIREYGELTTISTVQQGPNSAFSTLADYIFGGNQRQEKIAMTSPVLTEETEEGMRMVFFMPQAYDSVSAPLPNSEKVRISTQNARKLAVLRFSGNVMYKKEPFYIYKKRLLETLALYHIATRGNVFLLQYDDPWVPFFMRRNEAAVEITYGD